MYRWTDSDVEAIVGLVTRSLGATDSADNSLLQLLDELGKSLNACDWMFETDAPGSDRMISRRSDLTGMLQEQPTLHHSDGGDTVSRYRFYAEQYLKAADLAEEECCIVASMCGCQAMHLSHPAIACLWSNRDQHTRCLEYCRTESAPAFNLRDQAILRVMARQLEPLIAGSSELITKPSLIHDLSPRQREVLDLLLIGKNGKQIAAELNLSVYTVNDYIKAIYRRFDVSGRAELLAVARLCV